MHTLMSHWGGRLSKLHLREDQRALGSCCSFWRGLGNSWGCVHLCASFHHLESSTSYMLHAIISALLAHTNGHMSASCDSYQGVHGCMMSSRGAWMQGACAGARDGVRASHRLAPRHLYRPAPPLPQLQQRRRPGQHPRAWHETCSHHRSRHK